MAFRSRTFHAMYLAAGSFVFAWDAAEPHSLKLLKSSLTKEQPKNNHVKEWNRHFLERKSFIDMFSFPALKAPGLLLNPAHLLFWALVERTKILFPGSSVNYNDDVFILVSFRRIAILFLVIAFSQINLCQTSKKASKNKFVLSSVNDLQTSNIIFTVGANRKLCGAKVWH